MLQRPGVFPQPFAPQAFPQAFPQAYGPQTFTSTQAYGMPAQPGFGGFSPFTQGGIDSMFQGGGYGLPQAYGQQQFSAFPGMIAGGSSAYGFPQQQAWGQPSWGAGAQAVWGQAQQGGGYETQWGPVQSSFTTIARRGDGSRTQVANNNVNQTKSEANNVNNIPIYINIQNNPTNTFNPGFGAPVGPGPTPYYPPPPGPIPVPPPPTPDGRIRGSAGLVGDPNFELYSPVTGSVPFPKSFALTKEGKFTVLDDPDGFKADFVTKSWTNPQGEHKFAVGLAEFNVEGNAVSFVSDDATLRINGQAVASLNNITVPSGCQPGQKLFRQALPNGTEVGIGYEIDGWDAAQNKPTYGPRFYIQNDEYKVTSGLRKPNANTPAYLDNNFEELQTASAKNAIGRGYRETLPGGQYTLGIAELLNFEKNGRWDS